MKTTMPLIQTRSAALVADPGLEQAMRGRDITTRATVVRASSVDIEARTVEAIIATEQMVTVFDWQTWRTIDEVLLTSGAEYPDQVPMLESHQRWSTSSVIGSGRSIRAADDGIVATLHFADELDEVAEPAWRKVRDGHITDTSAGYRVLESVEIPAGQTQEVAGKTYTAGERTLRIATRWSLVEVSLVPIGADDAAKIRAANGANNTPTTETTAMPENLRAYLVSIGLRADATDTEAWAFFAQLSGDEETHAQGLRNGATPPDAETTRETETETDPEPVATPDIGRTSATAAADAVAAERRRCAEIDAMSAHVPVELVKRAKTEGWDVSRASRAFLEATQDQMRGVEAGSGRTDECHREIDHGLMAMSAGLMQRLGATPNRLPVRNVHDPDLVDRIRTRAFNEGERLRGMTLREVCRECLHHEDPSAPVPHGVEEMIRAAVSTGSFESIFTTSVNAMIVQGFDEAEDTTRVWTQEGDANDFKIHEDITLGKTRGMKRLARGQEAEHGTLGDSGENWRIYRYAEQFVLDEQDIIDDRMNALAEIPMELGEDAAQIRPNLVYAILLSNPNLGDGIPLFDAQHNNLVTPGSPLDAATLQALITEMGKQREEERPLNIPLTYLLVPKDLEFTADQLLRSRETRQDVTGGEAGTFNPLSTRGITRVSDDRLGVQGVTDPVTGTHYAGDANAFFGAANRRTVKVSYLAGSNRGPSVRQFMLDRGSYGMGWDIKLDIGAFARDFRGLNKNEGGA